jgi:hypothetical protein
MLSFSSFLSEFLPIPLFGVVEPKPEERSSGSGTNKTKVGGAAGGLAELLGLTALS